MPLPPTERSPLPLPPPAKAKAKAIATAMAPSVPKREGGLDINKLRQHLDQSQAWKID